MATSTTRYETTGAAVAFATLRFAGDALDPDEITRTLGIAPTLAYRKSEIYSPGPRTARARGRTGVWFLSTDRQVAGADLADHSRLLARLLAPAPEDEDRLKRIRKLMERYGLEAHVTCFWYGEKGAAEPSIPADVKAVFDRIAADIETEFRTD